MMSGADQEDGGRGFASPACSLHELTPDQGGPADVSPAEQRANIFRWRRAERERLIAQRLAIPARKRAEDADVLAANLDRLLPSLEGKVVSLSWPMPGEPLAVGVWDIPIPERREIVVPAAVLAPLVGFDRGCYRLGYGGGYFDRTLAVLGPRPLAIGVGFAF